MGVVFEAKDPKLGRSVALKVLNRERSGHATSVQRFEREARSSAKLEHPNVCALLDAGEIDGVLYFTMELVPGPSLAKLIEDAGGALPWRRACSIARDVALALAHAHSLGVIHRDVKPSNILTDEEGRAKVVDFGLARDEDELTRLTKTGAILGTPGYMAPERFDKKLAREAGAPSDIYALGISLYESLCGWPPYDGDSLYEIAKLVSAGIPPPLELPEGAPPALAPLVMKMIAREPRDRPASAAAVARALDDLIAGRARSPRGAGAWIRRNPGAFLVLCASVPVLPVLAAVLLLGRKPAPVERPRQDTAPVVTSTPPGTAAAKELVGRAREKIYSGDFAAATALYDQALAASPEDADALCEKATVPAIVDDLEQTLALRPRLAAHGESVVARVVLAVGAVTAGIVTDPGPVTPEERAHPLAPVLAVLRADALGTAPEGLRLVHEASLARPTSGWIALREAWLVGAEGKESEVQRLVEEPRVYEGVSLDIRAMSRGFVAERAGKLDEADRLYAQVKAPARFAARARGRRATIALLKGDPRAAVLAHEGHEPASLEDRLSVAFALGLTERTGDARAVLDAAVELADEVGEQGAIAHALGEGKAVSEACRSRHRALKDDAGERDTVARARGARGRLAAHEGDLRVAKDDLERLGDSDYERGSLDAVIKLRRGDFAGATDTFVATITGDKGQALPRDVLMDFALALELSGHDTNARDAYKRIIEVEPCLERLARTRLDALDAVAAVSPEKPLVDEGPSETLMTGGADGQGPRLYTGARWVEGQETLYGFAPTIRIPESADGRLVTIDVGSDASLVVFVIQGAPPRDEHAWWTQGYLVVASSEAAAPGPKLEWKARPGTYTILVARVLGKDAEQVPVKLEHVRVTMAGPAPK